MITGVAMEETRFTGSVEGTAFVAGLGGVSRIDIGNIDSVSDGFVFNEPLQLEIAPPAENSIEFATFVSIFDSFDSFHYNCPTVNVIDNSFADDVVSISHKPCLPAFEMLEMPLGRLCAFGLETTAEFDESLQPGFHATEELPVRCHSEFANADINSDGMRAISKLDVSGNKNMNEEILAFSDQISTACVPTVIFSEIFRNTDRNFKPSADGRNAYDVSLEPVVSDVISDRYIADMIGFPVLCNDFDGLAGKLGRKLGFFPDNFIAFIMDAFKPASFSMLKSNLDGFVEFIKGFRNRIVLGKLNPHNCFGSHSIIYTHKILNSLWSQFIPLLKNVGILATRW